MLKLFLQFGKIGNLDIGSAVDEFSVVQQLVEVFLANNRASELARMHVVDEKPYGLSRFRAVLRSQTDTLRDRCGRRLRVIVHVIFLIPPVNETVVIVSRHPSQFVDLVAELIETLLQNAPIFGSIMRVGGVNRKFFQVSQILDNRLDTALRNLENRRAVLYILIVLLERADFYLHRLADLIRR